MDNMTLKISADGDLCIGGDGIMETVHGADTTAQNIRMALSAAKDDFPLVPEHGTDYGMVFGTGADASTAKEAYREAIFQEDEVVQVNVLEARFDGRDAEVEFEAVTSGGETIGGTV